MAIAKVQYKENASATPEVWMDTTQKTVTAGTMLSGTTALKNDGTGITGNIASKSSSDLTASGATVTAPAGYYPNAASKAVASGSAGTPTASKGTVSNHSVSVTPSVTNTTGYITGGTKTGTAVTVSASELVSGTKTISASGTTDVTNYASASVAAGTEGTPTATKSAVSNHSLTVTPSVTNTGGYISGGTKTGTAVTVDVAELESGTKSITENGTGISVSGYSAVDVAVSGGTPNIQSLNVTQNGTYTASGGVAGYSPVTVSVNGGVSNWTLVASQEFEITTTSTSATNEGTIQLNSADFSQGDTIWIHIRDKAGPRNGYFYGTDSVIVMYGQSRPTNTPITELFTYDNGNYSPANTQYGVYPYGLNTSWGLPIRSRYNAATTKTIDGTYKCDVYKLSPATGMSMFE